MNDLKDTPHIDEEELNIKEIFQVIWRGKTSIILLSLTFFFWLCYLCFNRHPFMDFFNHPHCCCRF